MKTEYEIIYTVDVGKTVGSVGTLVKELNDTMSSCGVEGKLTCVSELSIGTLKCNRELTEKEQSDMIAIMDKEFQNSDVMQKYGIRVKSVRRKSSQPCSQSKSR